MKKLILLLMFFSVPALAEEPITGAFGMTLGEAASLNPWNRTTHDGYVSYKFKPTTPVEPFSNYKISVTPVKELVFLIHAYRQVSGGCTASYNALKAALDRKYGESIPLEITDGRGVIWERDSGEEFFRSIRLTCTRDYDYLDLIYKDYLIEEGMADELNIETESGNL
jgi:hypothetical protein